RLDHDLLEVVDVVEVAAVELPDRRVEVARNREVDEDEPAAPAALQSRRDRGRVEHDAGRVGGRDDDVDRCELLVDPVALRLAVRDERDRAAAAPEVASRLFADLAGAEEKYRAAVETAEDLIRQRRRRSGHRCGTLPDRSLRPNLPARVERLPKDPVEQRTVRPELVGDPHLAEDLALAGNERVEPGGDAEEVMSCRPRGEPIGAGLSLGTE